MTDTRPRSGTRPSATEWLAQIRREHAWAVRRLAKKPAFAIVVALTLGLAIGGNAAIYSVVNGVLLKPLPYPQPDRLVRLFAQHQRTADVPLPPADFHAVREHAQLFAGVAGYYREGHEFRGSAGPENLEGLFVTAGYFELLGARILLGRTFTRDDEYPAADRVILSERVWRARLDADPAILGRTIDLSRRPFVVIGVMAGGLEHVGGRQRSLPQGETADFWIPLSVNPANLSRSARFMNTVARLAPGISLAQANAELDRLARLQEQRWPDSHTGWRTTAVPLADDVVGTTRPVLLAVFGGVACVLLIACGNIACLTLSRSIARTREHAVRAALGASRGRVARELLIESWVLALLGACLGVPLAIAGVRLLIALAPPQLPRLHAIGVDSGMLIFGLALTFVTSMLCGLLPAWHGARTNLEEALREGGRGDAPGGRSLGWHRLLVVAQVALCFVLLVCAGLLARTFHHLQQSPIGFQHDGVLAMTFDLPGGPTRYGRDPEARALFHDRLLTRLREEPGVLAAGSAARLPFAAQLDSTDAQGLVRFTIGDAAVPPEDRPFARLEIVSGGYLETLGVALLEGRGFDARETWRSQPVVLVNQEFVRRYSPRQSMIGRTLHNLRRVPMTVVGVVGDIRPTPTALTAEPVMYVPLPQSPLNRTRLVVRTAGEPYALLPMVQRVVSSIDPDLPVFDVKPLADVAADAVATQRFALVLFGLFATLALGLSVIGIYGVLAYAVAHRLPELGVRVALGARPAQLLQMVLAQGARMAMAGSVLGAGASLLVTRWIRGLLFGVTAIDPVTLVGVGAIFSLVAFAACLIPARRAARVDPMTALRN
jgi:predicted permease